LRRFFVVDVSGEMLSAALFFGSGYTFGADAPEVWAYFDGISANVACATVGLPFTILGARHRLRRHREPIGVTGTSNSVADTDAAIAGAGR
jgi:membrane protein DedA with SNARE-associated domain